MGKNTVDTQALRYLNCVRPILTRQQFLTLRGQIIHGDTNGALRGLERLIRGKEARRE